MRTVTITAIRKPDEAGMPIIKIWRTFRWKSKPSFKKFISDYAQNLSKRIWRIAGEGSGIEVSVHEEN